MMYDSALVYFEYVINKFPDSKFRYQSMSSLNDINNNWREYLISEFPDSMYISDSSYKEINIIDDIYEKKFIEDEIEKLELLDTFSTLFVNESDSAVIVDSSNVKLGGNDNLEPVVKGDQLVKLLDGIVKALSDGANAFTTEKAAGTTIQTLLALLPDTKSILSEKVKTS